MAVFRMQQRLPPQPAEQFVPVGCLEHVVEGIPTTLARHAGGDHQQVDVVVAEHGHRARAEPGHVAQHRERLAATVYQVTDQP